MRCDQRNDKQSEDVMFRLAMVNDLAASECRYHKDCYSKFYSYDTFRTKHLQSDDILFKKLIHIIESNVNKVWSSSSFFSQYSDLCKDHNTTHCSKKWLVQKVCNHYGRDKMVTLSSIGHENIFVFKKFASNILKLRKSEEKDCISEAITCVSNAISEELSDCSKYVSDSVYKIGPLSEIMESQSSETLTRLLQSIHKSLSEDGPINSILLSLFTPQSTSLQCMLG